MNGSRAPWARGEDTVSRPRLLGRLRCDVAVVGAGLTGLSTAVELLERDPGLRVVVVEADRVASGASGRGTGLLGPRIGPLSVARRRYGDDVARASHLWSVAAVRHVLDLVRRHEIACDLTPGSQLVVARDEKAAEEQRREADAAQALALPVALVERDELPPSRPATSADCATARPRPWIRSRSPGSSPGSVSGAA
ncbi:NAD(P)/FAD-dependent oxidoreductase [Streptomyces stramineus]